MNFDFIELYKSDLADKYKINNRPQTDEVITNLMRLVVEVLQPLRNYVKKPIIITSGYRSKFLNDLVGGVWNSQHKTGEAVDFNIQDMSVSDTLNLIKKLKLPYDQLINEKNWVHISLKKDNNRKEFING